MSAGAPAALAVGGADPAPGAGGRAPTGGSDAGQQRAVLVVFAVCSVLASVDSTIVNLALPTLAAEFGTTPAAAGAVATSYIVSLAVMIPVAGWFGDRFGYRTVFVGALGAFVAASAACGLAGSLGQLVAFRIVQGAAGGLLAPLGMALLNRVFTPPERMRAARALALPIALGPGLGPVVGGLFVEHLSWRWAFGINVPVGLAALVYGAAALAPHRGSGRTRFDGVGFGLAAGAMGLGMWALAAAADDRWGAGATTAALASAGLGAAFVRHALRVGAPMVDVRLLADRTLRVTTGFTTVSSAAFLGVLFLFPLMQQAALGRSPTASGLLMLPEAVGLVLGAQVVPAVFRRVGPRRMVAGGAATMATIAVGLALQTPQTPTLAVVAAMFVLGAGMSFVFLPTSTIACANIPVERVGHASSLQQSMRQIGAATGVGAAATTLALAHGDDPATAYRVAFVLLAAIAAVASLLALRLRDDDVRATMGRGAPIDA